MSRFRKIKRRGYPKNKVSDLDIEELLYLWQTWHDQRVLGKMPDITVKQVFTVMKIVDAFGLENRPTIL